jgi:hypothetical protein
LAFSLSVFDPGDASEPGSSRIVEGAFTREPESQSSVEPHRAARHDRTMPAAVHNPRAVDADTLNEIGDQPSSRSS